MLKKIFKKKEDKNGIVVLDLGSESIKALLASIEDKQYGHQSTSKKRVNIHGFGKVALKSMQPEKSEMIDVAKLIESSKEAIRKASQGNRIFPKKLILGVGGDIAKGKTVNLTYEREDASSKINNSELRNIIHKLQWRAFAETRKKISQETGHPEVDIKLMHSSIINVKIDGYQTTNLVGFQGKKVEIAIYNSFVPSGYYEILEAIASKLELELIGMCSNSYALSRSLGNSEKDSSSAIFIDVGESSTNLVLVENGLVKNTKSFGIGGKTFTKRISLELNISYEEAEKLKKEYSKDRLEKKSKKIITQMLLGDIETWIEGITYILSEIESESEGLPHKIYLSGGGSYLPNLQEELNTSKWYKVLTFKQKPTAIDFDVINFDHLIPKIKKLTGKENIVLFSLANLASRLNEEGSPSQKILKKVIGIMKV